jgi:OmpA-OmpF porin, OOP family
LRRLILTFSNERVDRLSLRDGSRPINERRRGIPMKSPKLTLLGAALGALMLAMPAHAEGTYLKGELGGGFSDKYDGAANSDLENSWRYGAGIGTNLSPHVRIEGEVFRSDAEFQSGGGDSNATVGMGNLYYDFGDGQKITPFVGAGVGYGKFETPGDKDEGMTYQLTAGASTKLSDRLTGELAYKYVKAPDLELSGSNPDYSSSFVTAGLRWKLGG